MKKKILIADDDPTIRCLLTGFLIEQGYNVVGAHDGEDALSKFELERPDLILLDVEMPKTNGYAFLFKLRKLEGSAQTPVIVITSNSELTDIFMAEGVVGYFVKPFSQKDLLEKVRQCL